MNEKHKTKIINNLAQRLEEYVSLILKEYGDVIATDDIIRLKKIENYTNEIEIVNNGTISCLVTTNKKIQFPESVHKILKILKNIPGSGFKKSHSPYTKDDIILNDNTFETYMKHAFLKGVDAQEFYEENLLHESMHFCGAGGVTPLLEGLTEHRTRELAQKYNLKTTGCGYPKEVKIVDELQNIFGEKFMNMYLFDSGGSKSTEYLINNFGFDAFKFLERVERTVNDEFRTKYYNKTMDFKGPLAPIKKAKAYSNLKYENVYQIIDDYKKTLKDEDRNKCENKNKYSEKTNMSDNLKTDQEKSNKAELNKIIDIHEFQNSNDLTKTIKKR